MPKITLELTVNDIEHAQLIKRFTETGVAILDGLPIPDGVAMAVSERNAEVAAIVTENTIPAPVINEGIPVTSGGSILTIVELDSADIPWSADFHAATKTTNVDGTWKAKRGGDKVAKTAYEAECKAATARQTPVTDVAPVAEETISVPAFLNNGVEGEQISVETVAPTAVVEPTAPVAVVAPPLPVAIEPTPVTPLAVVPPAPVNTLPPMPAAIIPASAPAVVPPMPAAIIPASAPAVVPPMPAAIIPPAEPVAAIATPADVTLAYQTLATEIGNEQALAKVQEIYQRHGVVDPAILATNESLCATVLQEIKQLIA